MARPFKSGIDYFPLDVVMDDKIKILEAEHGLIGFGIWVKLHQKVYSSNYWIEWDKKAKIIFSNEINVDINKVNDVINSCIEWNIFDKKVFDKYSVLTSSGIQKRYFKICEKRLRLAVINEYMLVEVPIIDKQEIIIVDINSVNVSKSTQSKVKKIESKVEEKTKRLFETAFEKWWVKTPKRNGKRIGKKDAKVEFLKVKQSDWILLNTATENYCIYVEAGTSAKDPVRFLKKDYWKEHIEPAEPSEIKSGKNNEFPKELDG